MTWGLDKKGELKIEVYDGILDVRTVPKSELGVSYHPEASVGQDLLHEGLILTGRGKTKAMVDYEAKESPHDVWVVHRCLVKGDDAKEANILLVFDGLKVVRTLTDIEGGANGRFLYLMNVDIEESLCGGIKRDITCPIVDDDVDDSDE